eukprot:jgi/Tetstr1/459155/TSEL_004602.t1
MLSSRLEMLGSQHIQNTLAPLGGSSDAGRVRRIIFGGDLMPMNGERPVCASSEIQAVVGRADALIINVEAPVGRDSVDPTQSMMNTNLKFNIARSFVHDSVAGLGGDLRRTVYGVANNHARDAGIEGLADSVRRLEGLGGVVAGFHSDAHGPMLRLDFGGVVLGLAAWTDIMNWPHKSRKVPVYRTEDMLAMDWRQVKAAGGVDVLVAFVHWDREQSYWPQQETCRMGQELLARGFDAVVGHGPHVLQPLEAGTDGNGLIAYSIGNLCGERGSWQTKLGALLELQISGKHLSGYCLHPVLQQPVQDGSVELSAVRMPAGDGDAEAVTYEVVDNTHQKLAAFPSGVCVDQVQVQGKSRLAALYLRDDIGTKTSTQSRIKKWHNCI